MARASATRFVRRTVDWLVVVGCVLFAFLNLHPDQILEQRGAVRRRHGRARVGACVPARPPAHRRADLGLDARLVRRLPRVPVLHGGPVAADRRARRRPLRRLAHAAAARRGRRARLREHPRRRVAALGDRRGRRARRRVRRRAALRHRVQARHRARGARPCRCARTRSVGWPSCRSRARPCCRSASVLFLFDRNFTIYGGNVASTLAGEFAFSISLSLALLYLGVVIKGLRTGQHRALAAVLLALTGLCHLIPAFFAIAGTLVIALMRRPRRAHGDLARVRVPGGRAAQRVLGAAVLVAARLRERHGLGEAALRQRRERLPVAARDAVHPRRRDVLEVPHPAHGRRDAQRHALGPRARVRRRGAVDRVPDPRGPLPRGLHAAHGGGVRGPAARAGSGTRACCPSTTWASTCWRPSASPRSSAPSRCCVARDPERPSVIGPAVAAGVAALSAFVFVALPLRSLPGGELTGRRELLVVPARQRRQQAELRPVVGPVELHRLRGQGRLRRVPRPREHDARHRRGARLRPVVLGVREGDQPLRHADGARCSCRTGPTAASARWRACSSRRPPRRRSTSSPRSSSARHRAPRSATCPTARFDIDAGRPAPAADGRALLPGHLRPGHHRGARAPRPHRAGHLRPVGDLRGGRQRAGGAARERAGGARGPGARPARVDLLVARRERQVRRPSRSPGTSTRTPRTCSSPPPAPTSGSASTSTIPTPRCGRCRRPRSSNLEVDTDRIAFDVDEAARRCS